MSSRVTRATTKKTTPAPVQQQQQQLAVAVQQQQHTPAPSNDTALATLKTKQTVLSKQVSECMKQQKDLVTSQQFVSSQYDDLNNKFKELSDSNKEMRNELNSVVKKCREQAMEIESLKSRLNAREQEKISNNAVVRGISMNDDARESIKKIATLAGVILNDGELSSARHIRNDNKPPAIVASFTQNEKKSEFIKLAKQKRISTVDFGYNGDARPIFVDHQLTTASFNLFLEAKKLKKLGVAYVWIANGNILVREKAGRPATKVTSITQLKEIESEIILRTKKDNKNNSINKHHTGGTHHTENNHTAYPHNRAADTNTTSTPQPPHGASSHNGTLPNSNGAVGHNGQPSPMNSTLNGTRSNVPVNGSDTNTTLISERSSS